jgi:hypothetical protein
LVLFWQEQLAGITAGHLVQELVLFLVLLALA